MEKHLARRVYQMDMRLSKYFEAATWTVANLLKEHPSIPFNPDIATAFFRAGLIEAWGRGTLKIVRECKESRLPAPIFTYDLSGFRIEFKKEAGKSSEKSSEKIIEMLRTNGSLTIADLADHIGISTRAVEKQLAKLKKENIISRVGSFKGGYWKVIE
jgi:ATP-dependent DNA helicase RecG